jgi:multidrug efflux system membrane fusion protein
MLKPGNLVKIADVPIVVINQVNPIYVNFTVPQQYWPEVKKYMAQGTMRVKATIPQDSGSAEIGTVAFVDNAVDPTTGTIHLRATFSNSDNRLWPGLYVNVLLTLSEELGATVVPAQAILQGNDSSYVYIVRPDKSVETRTIVPGRTIEGETVIAKGLKPGEAIVLDGQTRLTPNAKVEFKNGSSEKEAAAPPVKK